jgi:hypothetical protein
MSFVNSILNTLTLKKENKLSFRRLKELNNLDFFEGEKERISEIKDMDPRSALRELMKDTNDENALRYYNTIRNASHTMQQDQDRLTKEDCLPSEQCIWIGQNKRLAELQCSNEAVFHPWKKMINICKHQEPMRTEYCYYHQKYCLDPKLRHENENILILIPNDSGLCNQCYILVNGCPPPKLKRCPGLRHKAEYSFSKT